MIAPRRAALPAAFATLCLGACCLAACGQPSSDSAPGGRPDGGAHLNGAAGPAEGAGGSGELFVDATGETGLDFVHFNGMSGEFYFSEMMGGGAALLDHDGDGDLDLFLVQGSMLGPGKSLADALFPPRMPMPLKSRLYRNELVPSGVLRFTDVTEASGLVAAGYGMGVASADFDNDGFPDLYVTNEGPNQLFRNNGDGTFSDVTARAGVGDPRWSSSASFLDYDRDGRLDLFVCNYVDFSLTRASPCFARFSNIRDYCSPLNFNPVPNRLYRNRGGGTFEDVTARSRIGRDYQGALGSVAADFDGDGWPDLYVANDGRPNNCWMNRRDGTFEDVALIGGCALSADGKPESSMGVDAGDFDADGDEDLFMTHLKGEANRLYVNDGRALFTDETIARGLPARQAHTGFGAAWLDFDNDGWLDLVTVNGAVTLLEELVRAGDPYPLHQTKQIFRNAGGRFEEISSRAGAAFALSEVSRGAAYGDVDNDGDTDVVVANNNGPARLLLNEAARGRHWIGLRLVGGPGRAARDMLGARVAVLRAGRPALWRRARTDGSYQSANDPRVLVGLGDSPDTGVVRVLWPGGGVEEWTGLPADTYTTLREGSGKAAR